MNGAGNLPRTIAAVLHDVDFAAMRPADLGKIGTQQPESRPRAGTGVVQSPGHFDPGLEKSVFHPPRRINMRVNAPRNVRPRFARVGPHANGQRPPPCGSSGGCDMQRLLAI